VLGFKLKHSIVLPKEGTAEDAQHGAGPRAAVRWVPGRAARTRRRPGALPKSQGKISRQLPLTPQPLHFSSWEHPALDHRAWYQSPLAKTEHGTDVTGRSEP